MKLAESYFQAVDQCDENPANGAYKEREEPRGWRGQCENWWHNISEEGLCHIPGSETWQTLILESAHQKPAQTVLSKAGHNKEAGA